MKVQETCDRAFHRGWTIHRLVLGVSIVVLGMSNRCVGQPSADWFRNRAQDYSAAQNHASTQQTIDNSLRSAQMAQDRATDSARNQWSTQPNGPQAQVMFPNPQAMWQNQAVARQMFLNQPWMLQNQAWRLQVLQNQAAMRMFRQQQLWQLHQQQYLMRQWQLQMQFGGW